MNSRCEKAPTGVGALTLVRETIIVQVSKLHRNSVQAFALYFKSLCKLHLAHQAVKSAAGACWVLLAGACRIADAVGE